MNHDVSELIEQYLLGQLSETEAHAVEKRAETDADFARELVFQRAIQQGAELFGDEHMRAKIAAVDRDLAKKGFFNSGDSGVSGAGKPVFLTFRWAAAAAILLLLGAGLWWAIHQPASESEPPEIALSPPESRQPGVQAPTPADQLPEPVPGTQKPPAIQSASRYRALALAAWTPPEYSGFRSDQPAASPVLLEAWEAFQKKEYPTVIRLLEPVRPDEANYWPASELYAHACFLSGKTAQAIARFSQIAQSGQLPFSERAEWYLLLCRLSRLPADKAEFETQLNKILADSGHPYADDAREIAAQVKNLSGERSHGN